MGLIVSLKLGNRQKGTIFQGPKLTFLGRRQLATEFFFKSPYDKMWSPKNMAVNLRSDRSCGTLW